MRRSRCRSYKCQSASILDAVMPCAAPFIRAQVRHHFGCKLAKITRSVST